METVLIHYSEIGLKKGNFVACENQLRRNIRSSAKHAKAKLKVVKRRHKILLAEFDDTKEKVIEALKFGIHNYLIKPYSSEIFAKKVKEILET